MITSMRTLPQPEILIGRWLAMCAHPIAAWARYSTRGRLLVLVTYTALTYAVALAALLASPR
jgi:hypothetical protein